MSSRHVHSYTFYDASSCAFPAAMIWPKMLGLILTEEHGHAVDHAVNPGGGEVILLEVLLELHEENGNTSEHRDKRGEGLVVVYTHSAHKAGSKKARQS